MLFHWKNSITKQKTHTKNLSSQHHHDNSTYASIGKGGITVSCLFPTLLLDEDVHLLYLKPFATPSEEYKIHFCNSYWTSHENMNFNQWSNEKQLGILNSCINGLSLMILHHIPPNPVKAILAQNRILAMLTNCQVL